MKTNTEKPKKKTGKKCEAKRRESGSSSFYRLEYHRNALALLPDSNDRLPGVAFCLFPEKGVQPQRWCTCDTTRRGKTCRHILELANLIKNNLEKAPYENFKNSFWYDLTKLIADHEDRKSTDITPMFAGKAPDRVLKLFDCSGKEYLAYYSDGADSLRFLERFSDVAVNGEEAANRASVLHSLKVHTRSDWENQLAALGNQTLGMKFESSFWHDLGMHMQREFDESELIFSPSIDESSGEFGLFVHSRNEKKSKDGKQKPLIRIVIPRLMVRKLITRLVHRFPNQHGLAIHPIPLRSLFKINSKTQLDMELRPVIENLQKNGETAYLEQADIEKFRYGDLVYVQEMGVLAELESQCKTRKFLAPKKMTLKESQIPSFLDEYASDIEKGAILIDASVKNIKVFKQAERVNISEAVMDRDWCWLSMQYGFGNENVSLAQILEALTSGNRYLKTGDGWVDCEAPAFKTLREFAGWKTDAEGRVGLRRLDVLKWRAGGGTNVDIEGCSNKHAVLKKLLYLKPTGKRPALRGLKSSLRDYQKIGLDWLRFLHQNGFGGLLCDDMGLGKTHQVMALLVALKEEDKLKTPALIVCPTSVLSHWKNKIREHANILSTSVFYGPQRKLDESLSEADVLITTYGIMRIDSDRLAEIDFTLAVFDEIQAIKNAETGSHAAAKEISASIKLGLTGTPVENRLKELKVLFDLVLPGYLGDDKNFTATYDDESDPSRMKTERARLSRLISPFVLRRMKKSVLDELPDKIEDIRLCRLSEDQVRLYRDAVKTQGKQFSETIRLSEKPVPYIHIFALLTMLKQICDHPALVLKDDPAANDLESGKWESFKELLDECLASGRKIVVYSQFIGMIDLIRAHLEDLGVGHVTLTGKSRDREKILARFAEDDTCRVFVGSLKAGGVGIDLVAASIVIHYDRWWNAAKEDQATDRVHRIGQQQGVQVFKFVTEGTLEEKISAIIENKRRLLEDIISEDDPERLKTFSKDELLDLLSDPQDFGNEKRQAVTERRGGAEF